MKHKRTLIKLGLFFSLCLAVLLVLPGMPVRATETEAAEYELNFTPGTGLPEELDKGNTDYGYLDMGSHANGEARQAVYQALEEIADSLWGCQEELTPVDGESYALLATIHADGLDLTMEELIEVYLMFKNDHPVYYYLSNTVTVSGTDLLVLTDVTDGGDRTAVMESTLEDYIEGYAELTDGDTIYEVAKAIHDRLIGRISYSYEEDGVTPEDAYWAHSIMGAVIKHEGVCETYAKTYQMLLNYYGIDNVYVTGVAGGDNHAWNMVKLDDGLYYYVDATWNDTASTENYFACGQDFTEEHTAHTPEGISGTYLYALPQAPEDSYIKTVIVYKNGEWVGEYSNFKKAFQMVTDEDAIYRFEVTDLGTNYYLPAGEWPEAKQLQFLYAEDDPNSDYYVTMTFYLDGDVYLNSDVQFQNISLNAAISDYFSGNQITVDARDNTMHFTGRSGGVGGQSVIISETEVYQLGIRLEGPEATLIAETSVIFSVFSADINIGTVYMKGSLFSLRGENFTCDTFYVSEQDTTGSIMLSMTSFYNSEIHFDAENMIVEPRNFWINIDSPNEENTYRIGTLKQISEDDPSVTLQIHAGTGRKIPSTVTIEKLDNERLFCVFMYKELYDYTEEELERLCSDANEEGDTAKWNYYFDLLWYLTETQRYPSDSPEEILTHKGKLLNIGASDIKKIKVRYSINNKEYQESSDNHTYYYVDDFLEVDSEGNVSRAKDEAIVVENGVLTKANIFLTPNATLTIPEGVVAIADHFSADNYEKVVIPASVQTIGESALGGNCVREFIVDENNPYFTAEEGVVYTKNVEKIVAFPMAKQGVFELPDTVTELAPYVFCGIQGLDKLTIPSSIERLSGWLIQNSEIKEVEVNCNTIGTYGFYQTQCEKLILGYNVNYVETYVLSDAKRIKSISILNPYVELASEAFAEMNAENVIVYGYEGSTAEEFVETYGEAYGLVFSALPGPVPTPKPTVTPTPEVTPNPTPEVTPDPTPEVTPDPTPEVTPTTAPSATPTTAPSATPTTAPSAIPTATPEPTATPTPTPRPIATPKPTAIPVPPPASREEIEACLYNGEYYALANEDVAVALNNDPAKLYEHWLNFGKAEGRSASLVFDAKYYLEENPDVAAAVGEKNYAGAYEHFVTCGLEEGRESSPVFNVKYYLRTNTDVAEAFAYNYVKAANHFNTNALAEGRSGSGNFDYTVYRFCNTDVAELYGEETRGYYIHYINHGRAEGRTAGFGTNEKIVIDINAVSYRIFDKDYYLETYPVLARTVGTTEDALYHYWISEGIELGHVASPVFNPTEYLQINTDVAEAVGSDLEAATSHFLNYGIYEGRTGVWAFDYTVYKYCNTDVVEVFGEDIVGYYFHYVKYGRAEGRTAKLQ